jgi:cystathionine gamma-lyase
MSSVVSFIMVDQSQQPVSTSPKAGSWLKQPLHDETKFVHSGVSPDPRTGAILNPLCLSTTFVQDSVEEYLAKGYSYSRSANPTVSAFEARMAAVENGIGAAAFGTGMAAVTCVISSFMKQGEHGIIADCSYGGTNRIARVFFNECMGMNFTFVDMTDAENVRKAIIPGKTKLIFSETPANPLLKLVDIDAISKIANEKGLIHVCDSTFATPVICRPIDHGAHITLQSTTKYYDGHNMTTGGGLICAKKEHLDRILFVRNMQGSIMSPFTAFIQLQTSKTMPIRVRRQSETAMRIAKHLEKHPKVAKVLYPGLESFPQKALADRLHRNRLHGGMLWFDLREGGSAAGTKLMDTIQRPWSLCENLGATESIITACAVMTHANMLKEDRDKLGITDGFIRVSCGVEDPDDLIASLDASLALL